MENIFKRRSIRNFNDKVILADDLNKILKAGASAPSACNQQPWEFIVVKDRSRLEDIMNIHPYSGMLKTADCAIITCARTSNLPCGVFWPQDLSAATQNILLMATSLGIGSCWLGVYPKEPLVKSFKTLFSLPEDVVPFSVIALGYPATTLPPHDKMINEIVHHDTW